MSSKQPTPVSSLLRSGGRYARVSGVLGTVVVGYLLLLYFPQPLFAYSVEYRGFHIHSRAPLGPEMDAVIALAEDRLRQSPINDTTVEREVYLTGSQNVYTLLSHKAFRSFANSVPFVNNVFINRTDVLADKVYVDREKNNSRSLSGVIAHETIHLILRKRYGTLAATLIPTWKNEGYCEYVARDSTITIEEAIRLRRENPTDDTGYRYVKYQLMVKFLLENEKMSVEQLMTTDISEKDVADKTYAAYVG